MIPLLILIFVQTFLAHFHEPQRLVHVLVIDVVGEAQTTESLGKPEHAEQRTWGRVCVRFLLLFVVFRYLA